MNEEELRHYGILGMKWGMRKAAKRGVSFDPRSRRTNILENKVNSMNKNLVKKPNPSIQKKMKNMKQQLSRSKERDIARYEYAKKTDMGKHLIQTAGLGVVGGAVYRRLRAAGDERITAAITGIASSKMPLIGLPLYKLREKALLENRISQKKNKKG